MSVKSEDDALDDLLANHLPKEEASSDPVEPESKEPSFVEPEEEPGEGVVEPQETATPKEEQGEDSGEGDRDLEHKPWLKNNGRKKKDADSRIKELDYNYRRANRARMELEETNRRLEKRLSALEQKRNPEKTAKDFPDEASFQKYQIDQQIKKGVDEGIKSITERQAEAEERRVLEELNATHVKNASQDLRDYNEVLSGADPRLATHVHPEIQNRIARDPVGPYVTYTLARDPVLSDRLVNSTPQVQAAIISQIYQENLQYLEKRNASTSPAAVATTPVQESVFSQGTSFPQTPAPSRRNVRQAPPKSSRGGGSPSLIDLEGDKFKDAFNKQFKNL